MTDGDDKERSRQTLLTEYYTVYDMLDIIGDIVEQEGDPSKHIRVIRSMLAVYHQHVQAALKQ